MVNFSFQLHLYSLLKVSDFPGVNLKKKKKRQTEVTHFLRINYVYNNQTACLQLEY